MMIAMRSLLLIPVLTPMTSLGGSTVFQAHPTLAELSRRAEVIRPSAQELQWQRIPWLTDLARGQQVAREEQRPILLWVTGDDPLERC